jgi:hypothetical protein
MTEVDNQDAAGADVCKIVGLAFRCERKATDRILKDLKQLRGGAGTPRGGFSRTNGETRWSHPARRGIPFLHAIDIPTRSPRCFQLFIQPRQQLH